LFQTKYDHHCKYKALSLKNHTSHSSDKFFHSIHSWKFEQEIYQIYFHSFVTFIS